MNLALAERSLGLCTAISNRSLQFELTAHETIGIRTLKRKSYAFSILFIELHIICLVFEVPFSAVPDFFFNL